MNPQLKTATPFDGIGYSVSRKANDEAPFEYVVLDGAAETNRKNEGRNTLENRSKETDVFLARVELAAPRWSNAREALVEALAIEEALIKDPSDEKAANSSQAVLNVKPQPFALKKESIPMALRDGGNARKPFSVNSPKPPLPQNGNAVKVQDEILPILKDGATPLLPLTLPTLIPTTVHQVPPPVVAQKKIGEKKRKDERSTDFFIKAGLFVTLIIAAGYFFNAKKASQESPAIFSNAQAKGDVTGSTAATAATQSENTSVNGKLVAQSDMLTGSHSTTLTAHSELGSEPRIKPSDAFVNMVATLRVSGVTHGSVERALINGRLVSLGDLVDPTLEVRLVEVDEVSRNLVFEDSSSARITLRF